MVRKENPHGDVSLFAYAYDSFDRLTGETRADAVSGAYAKSYGYDLVGNRLQKTENGVSTGYTVGQGNRLASFGPDGSVGYNASGCVTALVYSVGNRRDLAWNSQYQLTQASVNGALAETYAYDALGRRVRTVSGGVTENHLYNGLDVVADTDASGTLIRSYMTGPGIDNILSMTVHTGTPRTYYYIKDHLGSVQAVVDSAGSVVESYKYDAWGNVLEVRNGSGALLTQSAIGNRYLWQGREYSWATKLYYFRARWYDPVTGRWLSNDPVGISGGLNMYCFVEDNPVNARDPLGLCESRHSIRSQNIEGARTYFDDSGWLLSAIGNFVLNAMDRANNTAYEAERSGLSPNAADQFASFQLGGEMAAGSALANAGGLLAAQGGLGALLPAAVAGETTVSRWGRDGLQSGDWVMNGGVNVWNYAMSGKYQPNWMPGNNMPASFSSGQSFTVPTSSLQIPPGVVGAIKGALGQRIYQP